MVDDVKALKKRPFHPFSIHSTLFFKILILMSVHHRARLLYAGLNGLTHLLQMKARSTCSGSGVTGDLLHVKRREFALVPIEPRLGQRVQLHGELARLLSLHVLELPRVPIEPRLVLVGHAVPVGGARLRLRVRVTVGVRVRVREP